MRSEFGRPGDHEPPEMVQEEAGETAEIRLAAKRPLGDSTQPALARWRLAYPYATAVDHRSQQQN